MKKPGVVIFVEDDSSVDLAALQWVAQALPKNFSQRVDILFIEDISKKDSHEDEREELVGNLLSDMFKGDARKTFDAELERKGSGIKSADLHGWRLYYEETNTIQQILKKAIEDLKLETLVLAMAAVGSDPTRYIDLQDSKCSVVLAKTDPKPHEKPFIISATPVYEPPPPGLINVVATLILHLIRHAKDAAKTKAEDANKAKAKAATAKATAEAAIAKAAAEDAAAKAVAKAAAGAADKAKTKATTKAADKAKAKAATAEAAAEAASEAAAKAAAVAKAAVKAAAKAAAGT